MTNSKEESQHYTVTIVLDDEQHIVEAPVSKTLLDAALDADIDTPYSCEGGFCTSCKAKVTEGEAIMTNNETLNDDELAQGYILTCVAKPTTKEISINFD